MYRAVTWAALDRGIAIADEAAVTRLSEVLHIEVLPPDRDDGRQYTVLADGTDVTWLIREPAVNAHVSPVSAYAGVRQALLAAQRRIGSQGGVVMVGRDIGSVILPEAELKIYLDASLEERCRRRYQEARQRGIDVSLEDVHRDLTQRDKIDSGRSVAPLVIASDAVVIDTTALTVEQVVAQIVRLAAARSACTPC